MEFVGLTQQARDFVKDLEEVATNRFVHFSMKRAPLRRWEAPDIYEKGTFIQEIEQERDNEFIFTHLRIMDLEKEANSTDIFEWIHDPVIWFDYDVKTGSIEV